MSELAASVVHPSRLLKATDVAKLLNISKALAYRLLQQGEIPCVRIGTAVRIRPEDLDAYIANNLVNHASQTSL